MAYAWSRTPRHGIGMAVYKQKGSKRWWYKFNWNGELIRESTKQTNKRVAEQMVNGGRLIHTTLRKIREPIWIGGIHQPAIRP